MIAARENPFRSQRIEALAFRFSADDWCGLLQRLDGLGGRGLLLGGEGSGKTTLLEALARHFAPAVWLRLNRERAENRARVALFLATPLSGRTVCIDGLEQLGWWAWRRVSSHAATAARLIATSHTPGRLPIVRRHSTTPALLADLAAELDPTPLADADQLWRHHAGDLRACLRALYDRRAN